MRCEGHGGNEKTVKGFVDKPQEAILETQEYMGGRGHYETGSWKNKG
jgi:hypothetical protein